MIRTTYFGTSIGTRFEQASPREPGAKAALNALMAIREGDALVANEVSQQKLRDGIVGQVTPWVLRAGGNR
jgi:hypothetical protein